MSGRVIAREAGQDPADTIASYGRSCEEKKAKIFANGEAKYLIQGLRQIGNPGRTLVRRSLLEPGDEGEPDV